MLLVILKYFIYFVGLRSILYFSYTNFKSPFLIFKSYVLEFINAENKLNIAEKYGNWAVITGATDGIGKEYAKALAMKNINIVLISRSEKKLIDVSAEIEANFGVKTKIIVSDFTKGLEIYHHIKAELKGIPVGILVNNVGMAAPGSKPFFKNSEDFLWNIIQVNTLSVTMMSRIILEDMKKRGKGIIINISSIAQYNPLPFGAVYAATKSFIHYLNDALRYELKDYKDIHVQLVTPGFVFTNMTKFIKKSELDNNYLVEDVKPYVQQLIRTLGRTEETTGCWKHAIFALVLSLIPDKIRVYMFYKMGHKMMVNYRKKKLKLQNLSKLTEIK